MKCPNCGCKLIFKAVIKSENKFDQASYGCENDDCLAWLQVPVWALGPKVQPTNNGILNYPPGIRRGSRPEIHYGIDTEKEIAF